VPPADPDTLFRLRAARLNVEQILGAAPPPGRISDSEISRRLGLSPRELRRLSAIALAKFEHGLRSRGITYADIPSPRDP
jgi:AraC-like DNA-binding protein